MKTSIKQYKQELKLQAKAIRAMKSKRKEIPNGYVSGLEPARRAYRLKHIAYCLMRGRTLEQIERYPSDIREDRAAWIEIERLMVNTKMYVVVRKDLPKPQQTVQACHAVSNLLMSAPKLDRINKLDTWNQTKVILGVKDEEELVEWYRKVMFQGARTFRESDMGNQMTAFSILLHSDEGELFKELDLL